MLLLLSSLANYVVADVLDFDCSFKKGASPFLKKNGLKLLSFIPPFLEKDF